MLFNSIAFLIFFAVVIVVYPLLKLRQQNIFLLLASYFFYAYWDWRFLSLILLSTFVDFSIGKRLAATQSRKIRKRLLLLSLVTNLSILGFFKYFNFFSESVITLLNRIGFEADDVTLNIILPIGISFYTFQTLSYTIDIYYRKLEPSKSLLEFALFVAFFPQLVAGPIERAARFLPQISTRRVISKTKVLSGLNLVLLGFFKKIAIADTLAPVVDAAFGSPETASSATLWFGCYAFALQIYGDFSGYTDIARGVSRILGFELMENFQAPYLSRSITEFWRRWHISLSSWLRDYLYIPLGGNRLGSARTYFNLFAVMALGGLWHGASWNFVIWGTAHGTFLAIHRFLGGHRPKSNGKTTPRLYELICIAFTFHLVLFTWIPFRASDLDTSVAYFLGMWKFTGVFEVSYSCLFAFLLVLFLDAVQTKTRSHTWLTENEVPLVVRIIVTQILIVGSVSAAIALRVVEAPFIYFQF